MRPAALSAVLYFSLTAIVGIDVLQNIGTRIASDPGDPLLTAAVLTWNAEHSVQSEAWWQFPIFHPTPDVLAFSEHLLGLSVIATPLYWLTGNTLLSYNVTLLLTYPLCGLAMYALVYRLTRSTAAAVLAGLAYTLAPVRASQLPHIQLLATFYIPLLLLGLHAFLETGKRRWLVLAGVSWLLQSAVSGYLLIYGAVLVAFWLVWFVVAPRRWRELAAIAGALTLASIPLAPILIRYSTVHAREGFFRGMSEAALFAADLSALLCAPVRLTFWGWLQVGCKPESEIFPGLTLVTLCVAGAVWHWQARAGRQVRTRASSTPVSERPWLRSIRRALLAIGALFVLIAIITTLMGGWQLEIGPLIATSASGAKPASIAGALLFAAVLLMPRVWATASQSSVPLFYFLAAIAAWIFTWGPSPEFLGTQVLYEAPFAWLMRLPNGNSVRVPARFWLVAALCLVVLMGVLMAAMLKRRSRLVTSAVVVAASVGLMVDGWMWIPAAPVPASAPRPDLLRGGVVLELPAGEILGDIAAVYRAVTGGWRTINGFSGYEPRSYPQLREASAAGTIAFEPLLTSGTLHVLVSESASDLRRLVADQPGSELIGQGDGLVQFRISSER